MSRVTAMGCAGSALVCAALAVEADAYAATVAALAGFGVAGEIAAQSAQGPGSFAIAIIDALHNLDRADLRRAPEGLMMRNPRTTVDLRLNAIVDPERAGGRGLAELARLCASGGATLIQLRDKKSETRAMVEEARAIKAAFKPFNVPFVVNDRVDVALAAGADGVHLGPDDMAVEDARRLLGPDALIGLSIKSVAEAEAAPVDLIDYVGSGGVYVTLSKEQKNAADRAGGSRPHRRGLAPARAENAALRHRRHRRPQCRRSNRRRRRRYRRDLGAVAYARSGRRGAHAARHRRCHAGEARRVMSVPIALTIAGSDSAAAPACRPI